MINSDYTILLEASPIIQGGKQAATTETTSSTGTADTPAAATDQSMGLMTLLPTILYAAVIIGSMYFLLFRPQRKREKEMKSMQSNIRPGDNIVTTSGLYGKVTDVGEDVFVVEFGVNRGIRVPVAKADVAAIRSPKLTPPPITPPKE